MVVKNTFLTCLDEDEEAQKPCRRCLSCPNFSSSSDAAAKGDSSTSAGPAQFQTNPVMDQDFQAKDDISTTSHLHSQAINHPLPSTTCVGNGCQSSKQSQAPSGTLAKGRRYLECVLFKAQPCWVHWHPRRKCKRNCRFGHEVSELVAAFSKLTPAELEEADRMTKENWSLKAKAVANEEIYEIVRNCRKVGHAVQSLLLPAANAALQCLVPQSEQSRASANSTTRTNLSRRKS